VRFGRQRVKVAVGTIKTEKSGLTVEVTLPILTVPGRDARRRPVGICVHGRRERPATTKASFDDESNICSRTYASGAGKSRKKSMKSMVEFRDGAADWTRTSTTFVASTSS
jgi:hypothetical protein